MELFTDNQSQYIGDLNVGEKVDSFFKVLVVNKRTKRDGSLYLSLELMDKTGKIVAKIWDDAESSLKMIETGQVYEVHGYVNEYQNKKEIKIDRIRRANFDNQEYNPDDFIEQATFDIQAAFKDMIAFMKKNLKNKYLLELLSLFISEYQHSFKTHYGAQKIHHAHIGGLMQHTLAIIKLAALVADLYSLDKELLLIGALFHDIGKIQEFEIDPAPKMTLAGGLVGHLVIGNNIFLKMKDQVNGFPEELAIQIQHLILAHHGEKEFGSPEVPKTREAYALYIIDLLDSKINIFNTIIKESDETGLFSDYQRILERRILVQTKAIGPNDRT